jgi:ElaB/YqjD/DUF883 family membrane-anchored ribosome-binding protein
MSDKMSGDDTNGEGVFSAAKEAIGSAAEKVRATAPGTYDAGAKAARYVGETASQHPFPVLLGTAAVAFLSGWLIATTSTDDRRGWQKEARNWRDRGYEMSNRARSAAPGVSKAADNAGEYVSQTVRENPLSGLLIAAAVGGVLSYLFQNRPS